MPAARTTPSLIRRLLDPHQVVKGVSARLVRAASTVEVVRLPVAGHERVVPVVTQQRVFSRPAVEGVGARPSLEKVASSMPAQGVLAALAPESLPVVCPDEDVVTTAAEDCPVRPYGSQDVVARVPVDDRGPPLLERRQVVVALAAVQIRGAHVRCVHGDEGIRAMSAVHLPDSRRDEVAFARLAVVRELVADGHRDGIRALRIVDRAVAVSAEGIRPRAAVEDIAREGESAVKRVVAVAAVQLGGEERARRLQVDVVVLVVGGDVDLEERQIIRRTEGFVGVHLGAAAACRNRNSRVNEMHPVVASDHEDPVRLAGTGLEGHDVVRERDRAGPCDTGAAERCRDRNRGYETPHWLNVAESGGAHYHGRRRSFPVR